jgi:hypothetical protein
MAKANPLVPAEPGPNDAQYLPAANWSHRPLFERVKETLTALPIYFRTETVIAGIIATDLHTLNTVLGATIEEQVVRTLNLLRRTWDPKDDYSLYTFVRQPQTFPDVRLKRVAGDETIMGFDLKGWYLLAKEAEPSLRFTATANACAPQDLIVVAPWALNNVISGSPTLFEPYIVPAKFAAAYRNHHWQYKRSAKTDTGITSPNGAKPYPVKSDQINDQPVADQGGNFGRLARTGLMDEYRRKLDETALCGIKVDHWRQFLKVFQEGTTDQEAAKALEKLRTIVQQSTSLPSAKADSVLRILTELESLLKSEFPSA